MEERTVPILIQPTKTFSIHCSANYRNLSDHYCWKEQDIQNFPQLERTTRPQQWEYRSVAQLQQSAKQRTTSAVELPVAQFQTKHSQNHKSQKDSDSNEAKETKVADSNKSYRSDSNKGCKKYYKCMTP